MDETIPIEDQGLSSINNIIFETELESVELYRLVWCPCYYLKPKIFVCARLRNRRDGVCMKGCIPNDIDEVVVEILNMDKRSKNRARSQFILVKEFDLLSYSGNKRNMNYSIESKKAFEETNNDSSVWNADLMKKMCNVRLTLFSTRDFYLVLSAVAQMVLTQVSWRFGGAKDFEDFRTNVAVSFCSQLKAVCSLISVCHRMSIAADTERKLQQLAVDKFRATHDNNVSDIHTSMHSLPNTLLGVTSC